MAVIPYEPQPLGGLTVPAGESRYWDVDMPSRSRVYKIVVQQTGGQAAPFLVQLFNSENAVEGRSESDSLGDQTGPLPPSLYQVTPPLQGADGYFAYLSDDGGYPFFSQEKHRLGNRRKLWVKITNGGADEAEFALALGALTLE